MKIKKQTISTNWSWDEIEEGEVLIISKKHTDSKITVLVVDASFEIFNALDSVGISDKLAVLDLKDNILFLIDINDYIIISRFKESEVELGEEFI